MNEYELMLDIINTILSGISILFIVFGWIIPYKQSQKQQLQQNKREEEIQIKQYNKEKIDEQISKLYVPLYTLSMENKIQFNLLLKNLHRDYVFSNGESIDSLNDNDKILWMSFMANTFIPNLNHMKDILANNIHLIFEPEIPSSYQRFIKYTIQLNNDLNMFLDIPNSNHDNLFTKDNYPDDFDIYINKTLNKLLQIQRGFFNGQGVVSQYVFDQNITEDNLIGRTIIL